jgi:uncharacterized membrane protein (Fun14 family)
MEAQGAGATVKGWWQSLNIDEWFDASSADAIQVAICFVSFFAVGFLFKKYLKFLFMCLLMTFLIIKGLEYYKVLDIDWEAMNRLLGFQPQATIGTIANSIVEWVKLHLVVSISSGLGFLIGYKLG